MQKATLLDFVQFQWEIHNASMSFLSKSHFIGSQCGRKLLDWTTVVSCKHTTNETSFINSSQIPLKWYICAAGTNKQLYPSSISEIIWSNGKNKPTTGLHWHARPIPIYMFHYEFMDWRLGESLSILRSFFALLVIVKRRHQMHADEMKRCMALYVLYSLFFSSSGNNFAWGRFYFINMRRILCALCRNTFQNARNF